MTPSRLKLFIPSCRFAKDKNWDFCHRVNTLMRENCRPGRVGFLAYTAEVKASISEALPKIVLTDVVVPPEVCIM